MFDSGETRERNNKKLTPTTNASNGGSVKPERQPWPSAVSLRRLADEKVDRAGGMDGVNPGDRDWILVTIYDQAV